ncbi:MAG: cyclic dehypoxanthinyl futalosine synthase [Cyanobacteriota bacterium]
MQKNLCKKEELMLKVTNSRRLTGDEYLFIYENASLIELGNLANQIRKKIHPDSDPVTFVIDRNINYTNICSCQCKFCAFYKSPESKEGYVLDYNDIKSKINELISNNGTQVLLQGGLNPELALDYYINMLVSIKKDFPDITLHAFSPPEVSFIADKSAMKIEELLNILKNAGLNSIPGGGAEILNDSVRSLISPNKINSQTWLEVMEIAHSLNIPSSATMMAGSIEKQVDIIEHLIKIRDLQDKSQGFIAFIPWSFQCNNTKIITDKFFTGQDYLKLVAISRIILDNISNIQVSWPTQGIKIAQLALNFGANDFGGTMMEENVLASTGLKVKSSLKNIINAITAMKRVPAQRNTNYNIIRRFSE